MTARWLISAVIVAGFAPVPAARADEPTFSARTTGSPVSTVTGEWEHTRSTARLMMRGATFRLAPTTFDAGITFASVGSKNRRCPVFTHAFRATSFVDPMATFDIRTDLRSRRPGGRWSRWMSFDDMGVPRGMRTDTSPSARLVHTPAPACRGPLEYEWRVHGTVDGEALLAGMTFDLEVQSR